MVSGRIVTALLVGVMSGVALPAAAELDLPPKLTLSPYVGVASLDDAYEVTDAIPFGIRGGFVLSQRVGLELSYGKIYGNGARVPAHNFPLDQWGLDLFLNLYPDGQWNPYVLLGWAQLNLDEPSLAVRHMNGWEFGGGVKIQLLQSLGARWDLRVDVRDVMTSVDEPLENAGTSVHNWFLTAGLTMTLGNPDEDTDEDGVLDKFDACPNTIPGADVDPFGCALDYDEDGVPDGLDQCPATPIGATVNEFGCPSDVDGDGVMDGIDLCNDTLPGAIVDAAGCALDTDGDGVFDGIDQCPGTPSRIRVDEFGCPLTPTVSAMELALLNTGLLIVNEVYFETGTAEIKPESFSVLEEVGSILTKWSDLQIEIGGHSDSLGDTNNNLALSQDRANAVLAFLRARYPALVMELFTAVGYGGAQPLSTNDTAQGRALNQRIEFKVMNPDLLNRD